MTASDSRRASRQAFALVLGCFLSVGCCKEAVEKVQEKEAEKRTWLEMDLAKLFLEGIVQEDYAGAQILVAKGAPLLPGAKDAPGRAKVLREFVQDWLKAHGLEGARFQSAEIYGMGADSSDEIDFVIGGYFQLAQPGDRKVYFRLRTERHRIKTFELSESKLSYG